MADGENHAFALHEGDHLDARLHARALFGQDELAASKVAFRLTQQERDLQRKDMLAVEVLMQAVEIASAVAQEKRGRPGLAGFVTPCKSRSFTPCD